MGNNSNGWEPHFGSTRGIGPAGEAIEVIGLGRKEPRHRKFESRMLKSALRSSSRIDLHATVAREKEKPLPPRPMNIHRPSTTAPSMIRPQHARTGSATGGLGGLFSNLSLGNSSRTPQVQRPVSRFGSRARREPAEDLFTYLRLAEIPVWSRWPATSTGGGGSFFGSGRSRGFENMPKEWLRRFEAGEQGRLAGRNLMQWENAGRAWERGILEWCEENVPSRPIDRNNRWGSQIYALSAEGYDTLEFFDDTAIDSDDYGLLRWLTGSALLTSLLAQILQTAISTLHTLRYSSQTLSFHLVPSDHRHAHALVDGFGTLVLVNKTNDTDRAMILEVRPPGIMSNDVVRAFARGRNAEWWSHLPGEMSLSDVGQANLLQAQNQVFYFAVTNLKQWVFGHFARRVVRANVEKNANWSIATLSPVIDRKQRDPGIMQCLITWVVKSVDESQVDVGMNDLNPAYAQAPGYFDQSVGRGGGGGYLQQGSGMGYGTWGPGGQGMMQHPMWNASWYGSNWPWR
ncbi:hypothetical protein BCR39DRAFT_503942 [Naematelia encephala]|uniref:Uncharacterized protein n=1 Tax=Naematelia encephala TaxID=71784 RepID=A0A1Y2BF32_9TREE|nr:hypothetical protein BCR39DRAFT_503942 [Naematelia encephala]